MSRAHQYHQPNAPNAEAEDTDSDIEFDLHELDPITAHGEVENNTYRRSSGARRERRTERQIPLRNLRAGKSKGFEYNKNEDGGYGDDRDNEEDLRGLLQDSTNSRDTARSSTMMEDEAPLLNNGTSSGSENRSNNDVDGHFASHSWLPSFLFGATPHRDRSTGSTRDTEGGALSRNINIGQYPPPRFPPNAVSNAKYTPWSFLPRTLYNEFSFFFNMYFLLVALSQLIPFLRIGYVSTYVVPLACVLAITLGKEALDDIARRRRDGEANKEPYTVLRLRDNSGSWAARRGKQTKSRPRSRKARGGATRTSTRLDAIEEEEENLDGRQADQFSNIEVDEIGVRSRDLKVGDVLKLDKDQRVPADLVILKSYTADTAIAMSEPQPSQADEALLEIVQDPPDAALPSQTTETAQTASLNSSAASSDGGGVGEAFIRTDQLDGETDWKLRLASPLTQSLDPRDFTRLRVVAGKPDRKVNEFVGTIEYTPQSKGGSLGTKPRDENSMVLTAPLNIDNTAWANTVVASNATVLAVVVYTGAQTRQAMSTTPSRSKTGLLEFEINNLTKILCALTLTLSIVLVTLEGFESRPDMKWYVAVTRFLILFSTIIPISLRVNLDMGKTVYAWFIERDQAMSGTVVRTSTIPEELGRIEYLLSDKTGTLTQNGMYALSALESKSLIEH